MQRDCPEIGAGAGSGGRGVKAVEGNRTPSPGGITTRLDEHERVLRRWVSPLDGGLAGMRKMSKLGCDFVSERVGGEVVMLRDFPEFVDGDVVETLGCATCGISLGTPSGWDGDAGTAAGVLVAKEWVSGGIAARNHRLRAGKAPASSDHRRRRGKTTPEYSESGWDVCMQDVECEWIIRVGKLICSRVLRVEEDSAARRCHEEKWAVAQAADLGVFGKRMGLCRPFRAVISLHGVPGVARRATPGYSNGIPPGCAQPKASKSGCDFLWQEVGDKWLMPQDCPAIGGGGGEVDISAGTGDEGRDVSFVPDGTGVLAFRSTHRWKRWAIIGRPQGTSAAGTISGVAEMAKNSETWGGFVLHEVGGQSVRARQCPEFVPGAGPASSATPCRYLPARSGEDTAVGQKGILTLDLDLNHNLVSFSPARGTPPRTLKGYSFESGWSFIPQEVGGEWVITLDCPEIGGDGGQGVELIGVLITKVHPGFMLGVGGTLAHTPALSRSGEGEFSATRRQGGRARLAWRLAAEIRERPESGGGFVLHGASGELAMRQKCPEIGRGDGRSRGRGQSGPDASGPQSNPWRNGGPAEIFSRHRRSCLTEPPGHREWVELASNMLT